MCMTYEIQWQKSIFSVRVSQFWQSVRAPQFAMFHFMLFIYEWLYCRCAVLRDFNQPVHVLVCWCAYVCSRMRMISVSFLLRRLYVCACEWVCVFHFIVYAVLVHGTCLASNKNSLRICQNTHYTCKKFVFGIILYHSSIICDTFSLDDSASKISQQISIYWNSWYVDVVKAKPISALMICDLCDIFHALFGFEFYIRDYLIIPIGFLISFLLFPGKCVFIPKKRYNNDFDTHRPSKWMINSWQGAFGVVKPNTKQLSSTAQ